MTCIRPFITSMLIATLAFPYGAFADSMTDPMNVSHPAFAALKSKLKSSIVVPSDNPTNPNDSSSTGANPTQTITLNDLSKAQALTPIPGCNPVVWASLVQRGREATLREVAAASGIHNQTAAAMNNQCMIKLGPHGEDRSQIDGPLMAAAEAQLAAIESAICSLNFSALLNGFLGLSLNLCKGGQLLSGGIGDTLSNSFLGALHDITKAKDCIQAKDVNKNLVSNGAGDFGTNYLMGADPTTMKFDSTTALSAGSGSGITLFGKGTNVNLGVSGSTTGSITTTTSATTVSGSNVQSTTSPPTTSSTSTGSAPATVTVTTPATNIYK